MPSLGLSVTSLVKGISSSFIIVFTLNFLRTDDMIIFSFIIANFCPIQFLGPAEKGTYEFGLLLAQYLWIPVKKIDEEDAVGASGNHLIIQNKILTKLS